MRTEVYVDGHEDTVAIMYPADLAPEFTHKQLGSCGTYDPLNCMNTVGVTFKEKPKITKEEVKAMQDEFARYEPARWRDGAAIYPHGLIGEPTFQGVIAKDRWTRINERERTYHFANGVTTSVDHPKWLWPSSSGTHYIKDSCGKVHIINKSWVRITITE